MVFESLVVDLVNRFLGDFIENLDSSQLSLGIWGGDVLLNNLFVKENLFNDLDLPIRVVYGNIGQLKLKIPWKNLYTEPTVAILDGLYIIAVPNSSVAYDEQKEEKSLWDAKQKELSKIEEAKKKEAEKNQIKDAKQDSFAEKLVANVIKNLEVKVTNIHIRYEDSFSNHEKPFSVGITLKEVSCQTTDENWNITTIKENADIFHKLLKLDSLSLYWNINPTFYKGGDRAKILENLKSNIIDSSKKTDYVYVIEPLTSIARLKLNTKPEQDQFQLPKIIFQVIFEEISIALNKLQYKTLIEFLDSFERMKLSSKYRKYRPNVPKRKNAKTWWKYATDCVMNELVKRRRKMWSWTNMKDHRDTCRQYKLLYKQKIITNKPSNDLLAKIEECERKLDILNITIMRRQAEMEVQKEGLNKPAQSSGWFGGWLSWKSNKSTASEEEKSVGDKVQELMTAEEKRKLYEAIGYQENVDTVFPKEFIAINLKLKLNSLRIKLLDNSVKHPELLHLQLKNVETNVEQRPAAEAIKVLASMESLSVIGQCMDGGCSPDVVKCDLPMPGLHMIDVMFETNPLDGLCDTRIVVKAQPLKIMYHAVTIISLADFFKPPESIQLVQLQAAAFASLERMKEQTVAGLQFSIEQQKFTEVSVQVQPFYVLVPEKGMYHQNCKMMVLDMGQLTVANVNKRSQEERLSLAKKSVEEVRQSAYDLFQLQIQSVQVLFVNPGDNWEEGRRSTESPMHILKPMAINISLYKCLLEDVQLPKMRVIGELPTLSLSLSDQRLVDIMALFNSIPFPKSDEIATSNFTEDDTELKVLDLKNFAIKEESMYSINKVAQRMPEDAAEQKKLSPNVHQSTNIELKFEVKEICLTLSKLQNSIEIPTLKVVVMSLGTKVLAKPFDNHVSVYLGGVYLQHTQFKALNNESLVNLINTPNIADDQSNLLNVDIVLAQKKHPDFWSTYNGTLQRISISVSDLEFLFHQEAILNLMSYFQSIQEKLTSKTPASDVGESNLLKVGRQLSRTSIMSLSTATGKKEVKRRTKKKEKEVIDIALAVKMDNLIVFVSSHHKLISEMRITGLDTTVTIQKSMTSVESSLRDITVLDKSGDTLYNKILYFEGNQVFRAGVVVYNEATKGQGYLDMKVVDTSATVRTGCMKVVFINKFVQDLLRFLNQFDRAKASIMEAGSAAKEKAAAAAQDLSQKASRIGLDVEIKAPVVVIPRNRKSHQCLVVDLGLLKVQNKFKSLPVKDKAGLPAILDAMSIELSSVKLFRASVLNEVLRSENLIMEPMNLLISITRNLSSNWHHDVPDVDINGKLQKFAISVDQGDLRTVLLILSENLGDAGIESDPVKATKVQASPSSYSMATKSAATTLSVPQLDDVEKFKKADDVIRSTVKARFDLECLQVKLYAGGLKDEIIGGDPASPVNPLSPMTPDVATKTDKNHLAYVELKMLSLVCDIKSDTSMVADVSLSLFQICDARPENAAGITRMFSHANPKSGKDMKMMQLLYEQDDKANKSVDVKLDHLEVVVCLEFLLKLSDFYMQSTLPQQPVGSGDAKAVVKETVAVKKEGAAPSPSIVPEEPSVGDDQSEMKIQFTMNRSNVVMVEDPMNHDTNALLLQMEVNFLMRSSPALQTMKGGVKDLSIISCVYSNPETTKSHILSPVTLELQSCAPYSKDPHIALSITDIDLMVSATSIRIITATLAPLSKPKVETVEDILGKIPKELWSTKRLEHCNYWFLKSANQNAEIAQGIHAEELNVVASDRNEQMILSSSRIGLTLLGGYGKRLQPLIVTEIYVNNFEAKNWSTKLSTSCDITIESAYYNERLAVWEPIVEPVELYSRHQPWTISVSMQQNDSTSSSDEDDVDGAMIPPPAKSIISIVSHDVMQVTVTKSLLEVLGNLSHSFSDAYSLVEMPTISEEALAPYTVQNETGSSVTIHYDDYFKCLSKQAEDNLRSIALPSGQSLEFQDNVAVVTGTSVDGTSSSTALTGFKKTISFDSIYDKVIEENVKKFSVRFNDFGVSRDVRAMRGEKRAFSLTSTSGAGDLVQVVGHTKISYGCRVIILRSVLKVTNKLPMAMDVLYKLAHDVTGRCGQVAPGESLNLPCEVASTPPYMLLFKPSEEKYVQSLHAFAWQDPSNQSEAKFFECKSSTNEKQSVFIAVKVEQDMIWHEFTDEKTVRIYNVVLMPSVTFKNLLPVPVLCKTKGPEEGMRIEPGHQIQLTSVQPGESSLSIFFTYQRKDWTSSQIVEAKKSVLSIWTFESMDNNKRITLDLGIHSNTNEGHLQMSLYCPYWMINLTGQNLTYKAADDYVVEHPSNFKDIVFILLRRSGSAGSKLKRSRDKKDRITVIGAHHESGEGTDSPTSVRSLNTGSLDSLPTYLRQEDQISSKGGKRKRGTLGKHKSSPDKSAASLSKKVKVALKVSDSDWSDKFSLDAAGSLGTVECKSRSQAPAQKSSKDSPKSIVGVKITLASNGLTKIVTFTPYFMVVNQANFTIMFKEHLPNSDWTEIKPGECIPYWPVQSSNKKLLVACIKGSALETQPFDITEEHTTLLKLYHDYGGINVACQSSEGATTITFQQYFNGFASVLLVNNTDHAVQYKQKECPDMPSELAPQSSVLYTWQNPLDKRELVWSCGDKKNVHDELIKDGIGDFLPQPKAKELYWVSFLDGMQRVLLFTPDLALATSAQQAGEFEQLDQEINLNLQGFGLSLVNNFIGKEIAYLAITSSGVIWEQLKKKRFKALKLKHSTALEEAYQEYKNEVAINKAANHVRSLEGKIEADFGSEPMMMIKPHRVEIRRSFEYGIWMRYSTSLHSIQFHLKIHRMQLDSQLPGAVFPTVLSPVPPPKSVASENVPKPFIELSAMIRTSAHSSVKQFKYCKLLVQEMALKIDQGFLNSTMALFSSAKEDNQTKDLVDFKRERELSKQTLMQDAIIVSSGDVKNFYDMLHFSPLKIHLSFSMIKGSDDKTDSQFDVLGLFLQSVGVVLADVNDLVFKLNYFERKFTFYNQSQLINAITRHYSQQAITQMYVLLLGLDVIGNPYGVIRGLAEGIETLFYEPYQGAIQGPEEFAEGLALGVRSLFGHAVGGAAGAVSRITGALGKGIASLTFDEDFQKKRREDMNKKPADLKEGLARGGKGMIMGVFDGVAGIVTKPVEGAKNEGIGGFFKGVGKGLVGVLTRPASGVVDFASSSLEGIRRVAEQTEEIPKLRPMRLIQEDKVIRPYVIHDAEGNQVLQDISKGDFANELYLGHMAASGDSKGVFLITNKHLLFASKGDIFGHWNCDWSYSWEQLKEPPSLGIKGIQIILKERQKKMFGNGSIGKIVNVLEKDRKYAEFLISKMKVAMATATMKLSLQ